MATLNANAPRAFSFGEERPLPVIASDIIYEGSALGWGTSGVRPLVSGDAFAGFALERIDNSSGSAGDLNVRSRVRGSVELTVAGVVAGEEGQAVYATDDATFTVSATTGTRIGYVERVPSSGTAEVRFDSTDLERDVAGGNVPAGVTYSIGSEAANAIVVGCQFTDVNGADLAISAGLYGYLSANADGSTLEAPSATLTITAGTDGVTVPLGADNALGSTALMGICEADGDLDVTITETVGANTFYLVLVLPNGKLAISDAITFA